MAGLLTPLLLSFAALSYAETDAEKRTWEQLRLLQEALWQEEARQKPQTNRTAEDETREPTADRAAGLAADQGPQSTALEEQGASDRRRRRQTSAPREQRADGVPVAANTRKAEPPGPRIEHAIERVRVELEYARTAVEAMLGVCLADRASFSAFYSALSAMAFAEQSVRPALLFDRKERKAPLPVTAEQSLETGAGLGSAQVEVFIQILQGLAIPARSVELYYRDNAGTPLNHVAAEALWRGQWRFFDVTNATFFRQPQGQDWDVLSLEHILNTRDPRALAVRNQVAPHNVLYGMGGVDLFGYLHPDVQFLNGKHGQITLEGIRNGSTVEFTGKHRPGSFGRRPDLGGLASGDTFLLLPIPEVPIRSVKIWVDAVSCRSGVVEIARQGRTASTPVILLRRGINALNLVGVGDVASGDLVLSTYTNDDVDECSVSYQKIYVDLRSPLPQQE